MQRERRGTVPRSTFNSCGRDLGINLALVGKDYLDQQNMPDRKTGAREDRSRWVNGGGLLRQSPTWL